MGQIPEAGLGKEFFSFIKSQFISCRGLVDHRFQRPGAVDHLGICLRDLHLRIFLVHLGKGAFIQSACMVYRRNLDHTFHGAGKGQCQHWDVQTVASSGYMLTGKIYGQSAAFYYMTCIFYCICRFHFLSQKPVSICKFHNLSSCKSIFIFLAPVFFLHRILLFPACPAHAFSAPVPEILI